MLEEVCLKNGWGAPTYELHEAVGFDCKLYAYKVSSHTSDASSITWKDLFAEEHFTGRWFSVPTKRSPVKYIPGARFSKNLRTNLGKT